MDKSENNKYKILSVILVIAILGIVIFAIAPKYLTTTPDKIVKKIDFSDSSWIEQYVDKSIGIFGKDFLQNSAFSYNIRSNKMVLTYATQKSIDELRGLYLEVPGAELTGRNDETSLNITVAGDGPKGRVYNYYSSISRVIELELTLDKDHADMVIGQLIEAFPTKELLNIEGIKDFVSDDIFGGYVRYRYDNFDDYAYPYLPIFSRAYFYDGTEEEFNQAIDSINILYKENKYDETQNTHYYKINQQIVSISFINTDANETIISISIQDTKG